MRGYIAHESIKKNMVTHEIQNLELKRNQDICKRLVEETEWLKNERVLLDQEGTYDEEEGWQGYIISVFFIEEQKTNYIYLIFDKNEQLTVTII